MKKGFTLIELLAVIVILAIVALISMPLILNVIDEARKGAFKSSAYGIIRAGELEYTEDILNGSSGEVVFTYANGVESSSVEGRSLNYKGDKPKSGNIIINADGEVAIAIHNGSYCAEKSYDDSEVTISSKTETECIIDTSNNIQFTSVFGGSGNEQFSDVIIVNDGYIVVGDSSSIDGDLTGQSIVNHDAIIAKYDQEGNLLWCNSYGIGDAEDYFNNVIAVDDGYIAVGFSMDFDTMYEDAIIVKFDLSGNLVWTKEYGGADNDAFYGIVKTTDGYVVVGYTYSDDGDLKDASDNGNAIIIKYDTNDNIVWRKNYGGTGGESFSSIKLLSDGYIIVGSSDSTDGNLISTNNGQSDAIITKFDLSGNLLWSNNYGGTNREGFKFALIVDDGYIVIGSDYYYAGGPHYSAIITKYDINGTLIWSNNFGGSGIDAFYGLMEKNSEYIVVGSSDSNDGDLSGLNKGDRDAIIITYDENGTVVSKETYGGSSREAFIKIMPIGTGYIIVGASSSTDGDLSGLNINNGDAIIIKK